MLAPRLFPRNSHPTLKMMVLGAPETLTSTFRIRTRRSISEDNQFIITDQDIYAAGYH